MSIRKTQNMNSHKVQRSIQEKKWGLMNNLHPIQLLLKWTIALHLAAILQGLEGGPLSYKIRLVQPSNCNHFEELSLVDLFCVSHDPLKTML